MPAPILHTETQELRKQLAELRRELRNLIEEGHILSTVERPRIVSMYDMYFGELEIEKQRLAVQGAELFRRVELLTIKYTRGEKITPEIVALVDEVVTKEYDRMRQRMREAFDMSSSERERSAMENLNSPDADELVSTYRILVKKLHPDANGSSGDIDSMWHRVQQAYMQRNTEKLKNLLSVLGADEEPAHDIRGLEELQTEIEILKSKIRTESRKNVSVKQSEPFCFVDDLENGDWRFGHKRQLEKELAKLKSKIDESAIKYRELTGIDAVIIDGHPSAHEESTRSRDKSANAQNNEAFNDDFKSNTYFSGR
ncbi:MAG: hypothetical protein HQ472_06600 [Ignavibacteria bacterium]|nr:hypothetical protein [Ignavibacteria bacterium]